ncbi:MAG: hypothetical protein MUE41_03705 [Gemmatimonadaceae bacterium]|nr:hypothetical protein [Gemmatimonadaceae bacterium]
MRALRALLVPLTFALCAAPAGAQRARDAAPVARRASDGLVGSWSGTASVPLKDSTLVVPVQYTFTEGNGIIGGIAIVPGQGAGPISHVVREGSRLRFRVTAPQNRILEHQGTIGEALIEGMVHLDSLPVAKFRITPGKSAGAAAPVRAPRDRS